MHWLYSLPFDRFLAALVLIKYMAIFVTILLSNYQKSCFICVSSALLSQSINICTCHVYRCLSKASVRHSRFTTIHPDSSKTVKSRFIGIEIQQQYLCLTMLLNKVSARYIYGPITLHDNSATIHHGGATNAHDASKIRYGASMVQAGSATTFSSCCILDES